MVEMLYWGLFVMNANGLNVRDGATLVLSLALLVVVALLASYLPARRAMRVDPMVALRSFTQVTFGVVHPSNEWEGNRMLLCLG